MIVTLTVIIGRFPLRNECRMLLKDDHQVFVTLVNAGSFIGAANQLETTAASISRYLKKLEVKLGVQLVNRTTRSLSLTQAGQVYYDSCQRIIEEIRDTQHRMQNLSAKPVGLLKITCTLTFARGTLIDLLARFSLEYPDIHFELNISDESLDIIDAGFDLAIRVGELRDSRLKCRPLMTGYLVPCASPDYIARCGLPATPSELANHQFIFVGHVQSIIKRHLSLIPDLIVNDRQKKVVLNDTFSAYRAAVAGMGVTLLPSYLIEDALSEGRLVELFKGAKRLPHEVNLIFPQSDFMPNKTRVFVDYLVNALGAA